MHSPEDILIGAKPAIAVPVAPGSEEVGAPESPLCIPTMPQIERVTVLTPQRLRLLIIGGSGFVSGALARAAVNAGHQVTAVTRGIRPLPEGVRALRLDRDTPGALQQALAEERRRLGDNALYDLVVDCIARTPEHARQDLDLFGGTGEQLLLLSSDLVYEPEQRSYPQREAHAAFISGSGAAAQMRQCEELFLQARANGITNWCIFRPTAVIGAGGSLALAPELQSFTEAELRAALTAGTPLNLVGGGRRLLQPLAVSDLAELILACPKLPELSAKCFDCAGPEVLELRQLLQMAAEFFRGSCVINELPFAESAASHPEWRPALCHRIYSHCALRAAGFPVPHTTPADALQQQLGGSNT